MKSLSTLICALVFSAWSLAVAAAETNDLRGIYFPKKTYSTEALPGFEKSRAKLPSPILDGNPDWVAMYWKAWQLAFTHMERPPEGSPFVSNWLDASFDDKIYQWDTIFMVMFARYGNSVFPAVQSLDNFYCRQHEDGLIWRVIVKTNGLDHPWGGGNNNARSINPPLFSWAEVESFKNTGDKSRFAAVLPVLEKYVGWLEAHRKSPVHGLYWNNGQGSGMDNTPRDEGRPGGHSATDEQGWVDMSSQMVIQYNNLATMCDELGKPEKAVAYRAKAKAIGDLINKWCWNQKDGLYYDVDVHGNQTHWKTVACFWPMLAGITSRSQQAALLANLKDTNTFWRHDIFPSLAAGQPHYDPAGRYWCGGVWAPTDYMVIKGLQQCGYEDFATGCSEKYLTSLAAVFKKTGTLWEVYAPDSDAPASNAGGQLCASNFVGWTGCGPIALLIENVLGLRVDGAENTLTWRLHRTDRHGIENLQVGDVNVSVLCARRDTTSSPANLTVRNDKPFKLKVVSGGRSQTFSFKAGEHILIVR